MSCNNHQLILISQIQSMRREKMKIQTSCLIPTRLMRELGTENIAEVFRQSVKVNGIKLTAFSQEPSPATSPIHYTRNHNCGKKSQLIIHHKNSTFSKVPVKKLLEEKKKTPIANTCQNDFILLVDEGNKPIDSGACSAKVNILGLDSDLDSSESNVDPKESFPIHNLGSQTYKNMTDPAKTPKPSEFKKFTCSQRNQRLSLKNIAQKNGLKSKQNLLNSERKKKWYEKKEKVIQNQYYLKNFAVSSKGESNEHLKLSHLIHYQKNKRRNSTLPDLLKICHSVDSLTHKTVTDPTLHSTDSLICKNISCQSSDNLYTRRTKFQGAEKITLLTDNRSIKSTFNTVNKIPNSQSPFSTFLSMSHIPSPKHNQQYC